MSLEKLEEKLARVADEQKSNNGTVQNCPRCGLPTIKKALQTNAVSRRGRVYVCDSCGTAEAMEDQQHAPLPLGKWAFTREGFVLDTKDAPLSLRDVPCGTECWGWAYEWPAGMSMPVMSIRPVRGVLSATNQKGGDQPGGRPGWFVPYAAKSRVPAWTKAVRAECVNLHSDKDVAQTAYNNAVSAVVDRFQDIANMAASDLAGRKEALEKARTGRLVVAGKANQKAGTCAWTAIVLEDAHDGVVSTASGCFNAENPDTYMACLHALEIGAKTAALAGIRKLDVYTYDGMVSHNIHFLASEQHAEGGYVDYFGDGTLLRDPSPFAGSGPGLEMKEFVDQAVKMALNRLYGSACTDGGPCVYEKGDREDGDA